MKTSTTVITDISHSEIRDILIDVVRSENLSLDPTSWNISMDNGVLLKVMSGFEFEDDPDDRTFAELIADIAPNGNRIESFELDQILCWLVDQKRLPMSDFVISW